MTDEELIESLRAVCTCNIDSTPCMAEDDCRDALAAADRIEALTEQLEAARRDAKEAEDYAEELEAKNKNLLDLAFSEHKRADTAEFKLAMAVGLLGEADKRIIWEAIGFGNDFADRVDAFLAKHGATNDQG